MLAKRSLRNRVVILEKSGKKNMCKGSFKMEAVKQVSSPKSKLSVLKETTNSVESSELMIVPVRRQKRNIQSLQQKENVSKGSSRLEAAKYVGLPKSKLSVLKETNSVKSDGLMTPVKKNICIHSVYQKDTKSKENNKPSGKIACYLMSVNYPEKCTNQENIWAEKKTFRTERSVKKQNSTVDVYDIALDEDLIASEREVKTKKIRSRKKVNKNVKKKKGTAYSSKNQKPETKYSSCNATNSVVNKKLILIEKEKNHFPSVPNANNIATVVQGKNKIQYNFPSDPNTNNIAVDVQGEDKIQNQFPTASVEIDDLNENLEDTSLESSEPTFQSNKYLSDLADELEKSFMIPMTSTPDTIHGNTGVQIEKGGFLKVADISKITAINKNCINATVATPCDSLSDTHLTKEVNEDMGDITLFESPAKKKKKNKLKSPKKSIQINLFGETLNSPPREYNLEDSVIKPKKAYHTPDNFKIHIPRTKRVAEVSKKVNKKSKEDILIEKMTKHFDEISEMDLCIE